MFKDPTDPKKIETVAERFVDICADYGTSDESFREALGSRTELDSAINYYSLMMIGMTMMTTTTSGKTKWVGTLK